MASLPYPRTPLPTLAPSFPRLPPSFPRLAPLFLSLHALLFPFHPISFPLHTPYFCHPHRPTQMLVSTDADIRTDRRRCSYRPTRMTFVDVSQCQTFTFTKRSVQLVYGRALTKPFYWCSKLHLAHNRAINIKNISPSTPLVLQ